MTVLVLTHHSDITADLVVVALDQLDVPVFRVDPADIGSGTDLDASFTGTVWEGYLRVGSRTVDLADIRSVYYRRPTAWTGPEGMEPAEVAWAAEEVRAGFGGVLMSLDRLWINHPRLAMWASNKPVQLATAAACGFDVPTTLVTNVPDSAIEFASTAETIIYKTLSGSPRVQGAAIYTTRLDQAAVTEKAESITYTLHQFQHEIPKAFEVRLTVVGTELFAARIDAGSEETRLDWRVDYDALSWSRIEVPAQITAAVRTFMNRFELEFSTFDFAVSPSNAWFLFEANINGQWGFVEQHTKAPIAAAIARRLAEGKPTA
ncbi:ATP-grasp ribosomal peptide maturase [Natronoglycomyces albus]|uniref:ATP-grasp ribosomal peptide maturase n=1 Tax=Natronoglycomyces albus TaxID=2811108 RepID=A0A895XVC1_9ACTN|nr:ATP-grasp ribosomal peptide maturase [Natronoglycomyces albus]QSB07199.1 ATP-grasp ribosomal peptide maturase [Natronoglycomyces albus]